MNFISYAEMVKDARAFADQLPRFDAYVGIPRSGTLPAVVMALHKNAMYGTLRDLERNTFEGGQRSRNYVPKRILIVDDSYLSGRSMRTALDRFHRRRGVSYAALYMKPGMETPAVHFHKHVEIPRIFEWNVFSSYWARRACWDMDGVICHERKDQDYAKCKPYILPGVPIHSIVTARLEKYRGVTQQWLDKHEVQYEHLHMINVDTEEERRRRKLHVPHKVQHYDGRLFIESSEWQAKGIAESTGRPVLCTDNMTLYT